MRSDLGKTDWALENLEPRLLLSATLPAVLPAPDPGATTPGAQNSSLELQIARHELRNPTSNVLSAANVSQAASVFSEANLDLFSGVQQDVIEAFSPGSARGTPNGIDVPAAGISIAAAGTWSGDIPNGTIWPAGVVQKVSSSITVQAGATLTIQPGAIIKFAGGSLSVRGTLNAEGTANAPIILTSLNDDSVGGDTNANGTATKPAPGDWSQIFFGGTAAIGNLKFVEVRFAGASGVEAFRIDGGQVNVSDLKVADAKSTGVYFGSTGATAYNLTRVSINNAGSTGLRISSSDTAVNAVDLSVTNAKGIAVLVANAGKWTSSNTTLSGNAINAIDFGGGTIIDQQAWSDGVTYYLSGVVDVGKTGALTIPAGQVIKSNRDGRLEVEGVLNVNGIALNPVIFTSINDDSVGGDTNNNGAATTPQAGDWDRIWVKGGKATLGFARISYGGRLAGSTSTDSAISTSFVGATLSLSDSSVTNSFGEGVWIASGTGTLTNVAISDIAKTGVRISSSDPGTVALNSVRITNTGGDAVQVSSTTLFVNATNLDLSNIGGLPIVAADAGKWTDVNTQLTGTGTRAIEFKGGTINDARAWDENFVYFLGGVVDVGKTGTLTIPAGQVIKSNRDARLEVEGTLNVSGTRANPVTFTSINDDSVGGDTNKDAAATSPQPGDWDRIWIKAGKANITFGRILYGGRIAGSTSVDSAISTSFAGAALAMSDSTVANSFGEGIWIATGSGTLLNNTISNVAKTGIRIDANEPQRVIGNNISNAKEKPITFKADTPIVAFGNSSIGSGFADAIVVRGGSIAKPSQWQDSLTYYISDNVTVSSTGTLTISPGTVLKMGIGVQLRIEGTLSALGTADAPIIFTSFKDDSLRGDTNGDAAASAPQPGDWDRIYVIGTAARGTLDHVELRYGGKIFSSNPDSSISISGDGNLTLTNSLIRDGLAEGIWVASGTATLTGNTILRVGKNGLRADDTRRKIIFTGNTIDGAHDGAILIKADSDVDLTDSTWTNSGRNNSIFVDSGNGVSGTHTWRGNAVYQLSDNLQVSTGGSLTLNAGAILKFASRKGLQLDGTLKVQGAVDAPVIFTSIKDDSAGGDTNLDGNASAPANGDWFSIWQRGGAADLNFLEVRYAGIEPISTSFSGTPAILTDAGTMSLRNSTIRNAFDVGFRARRSGNATAENLTIRDVQVDGISVENTAIAHINGAHLLNIGKAVMTVHANSIWTLDGLDFTNAKIPGMVVAASGSLRSNWTVGQLGLVIFDSSDSVLDIPSQFSFTILPGTTLKLRKDYQISGSGKFIAIGTPTAPILLTSIKDDAAGGDTNGDGAATVPAAGDWGAVQLNNTASTIAFAELRYGGSSVAFLRAMLSLNNPGQSAYNLIVHDSASGGIGIGGSTAATIEDSLVYNFVGNGILRDFGGGTSPFRLTNNTIYGGQVGVLVNSSAALLVNNIIAGAAVAGVQSAGGTLTVRYNDLFNPASKNYFNANIPTFQPLDRTGELTGDPLFENAAAGKFNLGDGSPAIDSASGPESPFRDLLFRSRFDDPAVPNRGTGFPSFVDIGALERQDSSNAALRPDLSVAGPVTVQAVNPAGPLGLLTGDRVNVGWSVRNGGVSAASGDWRDDIFISSDDKWDIGDRLIGSLVHSGGLAAAQSYQGTLALDLPPVVDGNYYILVRANSDHRINEVTEENNTAASDPFALAVPVLPLNGTTAPGLSAGKQESLFKVVVAAGSSSDLRVTLAGLTDRTGGSLLMAKDRVPTIFVNDARSVSSPAADPAVQFSLDQPGTYYVLVHVDNPAQNAGAVLRTETLSLAILSVSPNRIGNAGDATLTIVGSQFTPDSAVSLLSADRQRVLEATAVNVNDSTSLAATFNLLSAAPGTYDVRVTTPAGQIIKAGAVEIINASAGEEDLVMNVIAPQFLRLDSASPTPFILEVTNKGANDVLAPLIHFTALSEKNVSQAMLRLNPNGPIRSSFDIVLFGRSGVPGLIQAGETIRVSVEYLGWDLTGTIVGPNAPTPGQVAPPSAFELQTVPTTVERPQRVYGTVSRAGSSSNPVDMTKTKDAIPPQYWTQVRDRLNGGQNGGNNNGDPTLGTYSRAIYDEAKRMNRIGVTGSNDAGEVFNQIYHQIVGTGEGKLIGIVINAKTNKPVPGAQVFFRSTDPGGAIRFFQTEDAGKFVADTLPSDEYKIQVTGYTTKSPPSVRVIAGDDEQVTVLVEQIEEQPKTVPRDTYETPFLILADGVAQLAFVYNGQIYHTSQGATGWNTPVAVPKAVGHDPILVYSQTLLKDAQGASVPGLGLFFRQTGNASANDSVIEYALAQKQADGSWKWSKPANYSPSDAQAANFNHDAIVDAAGQAVVIWQRQDLSNPNDQSRLYFDNRALSPTSVSFDDIEAFVVLDEPAFLSTGDVLPAGTAFAVTKNQDLVLLAGQTSCPGCDPNWSVSFDKSYEFSKKGQVPNWVPYIGGENSVVFSAGLKGQANLSGASASASLTGSVSVMQKRVTGSVSGTITANWLLDRVACRYVFKDASLTATLSLKGKFPIPQATYYVEVFGYSVAKLEVGVQVEGKLSGTLTWSEESGLIPDGKVTGSLSLGFYGLADIFDGTAKANVTGTGNVVASIDKNGFHVDDVFLSFEAKVTLFGKEVWTKKVRFPAKAGGKLDSLADLFADTNSDQLEETTTITLQQKGGTTTVYAGRTVLSSVDLADNGPAALALGKDGLVYAFWTRESLDPNTFGNTVWYATFDGKNWSQPAQVPSSLGFNRNLAVARDASGNLVLAYSHADSTTVNSGSSPDAIQAANENSNVWTVVFDGGTFSAPRLLKDLPNAAHNLAMGTESDGDVWLMWTEGSGNDAVLYASQWTGSTWNEPTTITHGFVVGDATERDVNGLTTVVWTQASRSLERNAKAVEETALYTSTFVNGSWTAALRLDFGPLTGATSPEQSAAALPINLSSLVALQNVGGGSSWSLPVSPPKACCGCNIDPKKLPPPPKVDVPRGTPDPNGRTPGDANSCSGVVGSNDPNDKLGPGFGPKGYVNGADPFNYTVLFENDPKVATAPALKVKVTDQLASSFDFASFAFTKFQFGNHIISLPAGLQQVHTAVNAQNLDGSGLIVEITATFDKATGQISVVFQSIDPATGRAPLDPFAGFLPPDDNTQRGEGLIAFVVKPKAGLANATEIRNTAEIVFDSNELIRTPTKLNTIDNKAPQVLSFKVNNGGPERSNFRSLVINFAEDSDVNFFDRVLKLKNKATGAELFLDGKAFSYDPLSGAATLNLAPAQVPNGDYTAVLIGANIRDGAGNAMASDYTFDLHLLAGDANGDRVTNDLDLFRVWQNQLKPATARDLNDDLNGDGTVDLLDLDLIRGNYLAAVPTQAVP